MRIGGSVAFGDTLEIPMPLTVGDTAPSFTLPEAPGQMVDVGACYGTGPVVVLFYPFAFSGVCTEEFCRFRDDWATWSELGAKVFGISVDSAFASAKFRELENLPFPLLSDFNKTVGASWGVLHDDAFGQKGVTMRAAFVVGLDGVVTYAWSHEDGSNQVDFEAIRTAVESCVATS